MLVCSGVFPSGLQKEKSTFHGRLTQCCACFALCRLFSLSTQYTKIFLFLGVLRSPLFISSVFRLGIFCRSANDCRHATQICPQLCEYKNERTIKKNYHVLLDFIFVSSGSLLPMASCKTKQCASSDFFPWLLCSTFRFF
jgi:hypothetical protein